MKKERIEILSRLAQLTDFLGPRPGLTSSNPAYWKFWQEEAFIPEFVSCCIPIPLPL